MSFGADLISEMALWPEFRHGELSAWVLSFPSKNVRIAQAPPNAEWLARELQNLILAHPELSPVELRELCRLENIRFPGVLRGTPRGRLGDANRTPGDPRE